MTDFQLDQYLKYSKTRRGVSIICFISCGLIILSFYSTFTATTEGKKVEYSILTSEQKNYLVIFAIGTFVALAFLNIVNPSTTPHTKDFKCLSCNSLMEAVESKCQNCGARFTLSK